jgi:hypothetical protein
MRFGAAAESRDNVPRDAKKPPSFLGYGRATLRALVVRSSSGWETGISAITKVFSEV